MMRCVFDDVHMQAMARANATQFIHPDADFLRLARIRIWHLRPTQLRFRGSKIQLREVSQTILDQLIALIHGHVSLSSASV